MIGPPPRSTLFPPAPLPLSPPPQENPRGPRRRSFRREVSEQPRREARDARKRGPPAGPVAHHANAHGPSQDRPREHTPHDLGGIDRRAARVSHAEPEQHAQRHGGESQDER